MSVRLCGDVVGTVSSRDGDWTIPSQHNLASKSATTEDGTNKADFSPGAKASRAGLTISNLFTPYLTHASPLTHVQAETLPSSSSGSASSKVAVRLLLTLGQQGSERKKARRIMDDSAQFRKLQDQLRVSGVVTGVGTRQVLHDLIEERIEDIWEIRRKQATSSSVDCRQETTTNAADRTGNESDQNIRNPREKAGTVSPATLQADTLCRSSRAGNRPQLVRRSSSFKQLNGTRLRPLVSDRKSVIRR